MSMARTRPSSTTSPDLMSREARITKSGVMRFAAPRSSPAPHFEGQRASGAGGLQVCAVAEAEKSSSSAAVAARSLVGFIAPPQMIFLTGTSLPYPGISVRVGFTLADQEPGIGQQLQCEQRCEGRAVALGMIAAGRRRPQIDDRAERP